MNFGERLQRVLNETGMSQSELGRRVGATSQSVNGWCQSGILPRKDVLDLLPKATGKPLYWFFMEDEEESDAPLHTQQAYADGLNDRQKRLLDVFDQLPTAEQDRFIDLAGTRLKELDDFMAEYQKRRKIEPPSR
ncbi:transcriptional regulator [Buttiauxella sp.]|uniref:transcriptional regulator n=1 Tax=Buttiauxella sp. TaxID=1972222 RepID=UPI003C770231